MKKFVESCLQQQGKWTSPGGNTKQFKSCNNKLVITWYNKKQHTLVFQGQDGPVLKEKLVKIVQDKLETKTDSPDRSTSHDEIKQTTDAEVDSVLEDSLLAEVNDIKHNLVVLKKQVEENTRLLSRNPQNQENITNKELRKQNERCEKLQAALGNKDMEINELKLKIASLETRASSAEQENDSLKLALKIIMQEKSEGECQLQDNQIHEVTVPQRNSKSAADRRCHKTNPNRKGKENLKRSTIALQNRFQVLENTLETTTDKGNAEDSDRDDNSACLTIIAGDSVLKHLKAHKMSKDNNKVRVSTFPGCTTKDMRDHIKPIIRKKPDQLIIHVGTNSLRDSESPTACSEEIIDLVSWAKSAAPGTEVVLSSLTARSDDDQIATQVEEVNSNLKKFCRQNKWKMIVHSNITAEHHLNRSGLHLNKVGTSRLARNFLDFLKNKD